MKEYALSIHINVDNDDDDDDDDDKETMPVHAILGSLKNWGFEIRLIHE